MSSSPAPSDARSDRRTPGSIAGGLATAQWITWPGTSGNAGRAPVKRLLNTVKSGRTNRAQRSGQAGVVTGACCQKPIRAPPARAVEANIACGQALWKIEKHWRGNQ